MTKVRGHICIRRQAKDGATGEAGKSIRTTVWETSKQYYAGDTQVDGVYPLDIVSDKTMAIGTSGVNFYMCIRSHTSSSNIPLTNTSYWQKLNSLKPVVTYLILAEAIKANLIDVADLAAATAFINALTANTAFIDNLSVKHLDGADGVFSGSLDASLVSTETDHQGYTYELNLSPEYFSMFGHSANYAEHGIVKIAPVYNPDKYDLDAQLIDIIGCYNFNGPLIAIMGGYLDFQYGVSLNPSSIKDLRSINRLSVSTTYTFQASSHNYNTGRIFKFVCISQCTTTFNCDQPIRKVTKDGAATTAMSVSTTALVFEFFFDGYMYHLIELTA